MTRGRAFFLREASECLGAAEGALQSEPVDLAAVHLAVRRFRGSAQMARFGALADTALELEERLRPYRGGSGAAADPSEDSVSDASDEVRRTIRTVLDSLGREVEAVRAGQLEEDPRMEAGMEEPGVSEATDGLEVVSIETLEYRGESALARALELREALEDAIVSQEAVGPILDELFDLIRLGSK